MSRRARPLAPSTHSERTRSAPAATPGKRTRTASAYGGAGGGASEGPASSTVAEPSARPHNIDFPLLPPEVYATEEAETAVSRASLPGELRERFEQSLGTDLSGVRVHTGADSHQAADAVGARAYTIGNDIHFGAGEYDPRSTSGQELIAHEVAHTVQQRGGAPVQQNKLAVSSPSDPLEVEADAAASAMVRGQPASLSTGSGLLIARKDSGKKGAKKGGKDDDKDEMVKVNAEDRTITVQPFPGGKSVKIDCKNGEVSVPAGSFEGKAEHTFKPVSFTAPLGAGFGVKLKISGSVDLTAKGELTAKGGQQEYNDAPYANPMGWYGSITGSGSVRATAKGRLEVNGYTPTGTVNLHAGAYGELKGSIGMDASLGGGFSIDPAGRPNGGFAVACTPELTVTATGGLHLGWEVGRKSGTFYETELVSVKVLKALIDAGGTYSIRDKSFKRNSNDPVKIEVLGLNFNKPKKVEKNLADAGKRAGDEIERDHGNCDVDDKPAPNYFLEDEDKNTKGGYFNNDENTCHD